MKVLKILGIIFVVLVVAIGGFAYWGVSQFDNLIKKGIEQAGTEIMGVPVTVAGIETSFTQVRGEVSGLVIGNPSGFSTDHAFSLGKVAVQLDPGQMQQNQGLIVIKEILIDGANVIYEEKDLTNSNLKTISDHISQKISSSGNNDEQPSESSDAGPRFKVENFTFSNAEVKLVSAQYGDKSLSIPSIVAENIGGEAGVTGEELGAYIMDQVVNRTQDLVKDEIGDRAKAEIRDRASQAIEENLSDEDKEKLDRVKGLLNR